jgi:hypothetical protein
VADYVAKLEVAQLHWCVCYNNLGSQRPGPSPGPGPGCCGCSWDLLVRRNAAAAGGGPAQRTGKPWSAQPWCNATEQKDNGEGERPETATNRDEISEPGRGRRERV